MVSSLRPLVGLLAVTLSVTACSSNPVSSWEPEARAVAPVRAYQTRVFEASQEVVMKSIIHVLQDEGFSITNIDSTLGVISATREREEERSKVGRNLLGGAAAVVLTGGFALLFLPVAASTVDWSENMTVLADGIAQLTQRGGDTEVRLSFVRKYYGAEGELLKSEQEIPLELYQYAFDRIGKSLFLQQTTQ